MSNTSTVATLIENSRRMGKDTFHTAAALSLVTGDSWRPLCCWCLEKIQLSSDDRIEAHRTADRADNFCACGYIGRDVLVAKA
jgi:hypothetical protein